MGRNYQGYKLVAAWPRGEISKQATQCLVSRVQGGGLVTIIVVAAWWLQCAVSHGCFIQRCQVVALEISWGMLSAVMVSISGNELAGRRWQWSSMMCPLFASAVGYSRQTPGFRKSCKATWAAT